jgi:hypothetical protein
VVIVPALRVRNRQSPLLSCTRTHAGYTPIGGRRNQTQAGSGETQRRPCSGDN